MDDNTTWFAKYRNQLAAGQDIGRDLTVLTDWMAARMINLGWTEEMVHERLEAKMTAAFRAVHSGAQAHRVDNRMAAYLVAVARVAEAMKVRGWV